MRITVIIETDDSSIRITSGLWEPEGRNSGELCYLDVDTHLNCQKNHATFETNCPKYLLGEGVWILQNTYELL